MNLTMNVNTLICLLSDGSLSRTQTGHSHAERSGAVLLRCIQESVRQQGRDSADCKVSLSSVSSQQFVFSEFPAATLARIKFSSFVVNRDLVAISSKRDWTHTYCSAFFLYRDKLVWRKVLVLYSDSSLILLIPCVPSWLTLCYFFPPVCYVTIRRPMTNLRRCEWAAWWWDHWDSFCLISCSLSTPETPCTRSVVVVYRHAFQYFCLNPFKSAFVEVSQISLNKPCLVIATLVFRQVRLWNNLTNDSTTQP